MSIEEMDSMLDGVLAPQTEKQVKKELDDAREIAKKKMDEIPSNLDYNGWSDYWDEAHLDVLILSRRYRMMKTPKMTDHDDFNRECLMSFEEFKACCESGGFIDSDGSGIYSSATQESNISISPSDFTYDKVRSDFTHVCWYNK